MGVSHISTPFCSMIRMETRQETRTITARAAREIKMTTGQLTLDQSMFASQGPQ